MLPDGAMKYIHAIGHPVFNASGDPVELVGTVMDVTNASGEEKRPASRGVAEGQQMSETGKLALHAHRRAARSGRGRRTGFDRADSAPTCATGNAYTDEWPGAAQSPHPRHPRPARVPA